ncbi:MAG: hypothetical protein COC06_05460 [Bacteroidales bacterium]|nr:MAG: hypothetical protein COC06_05460 [Bacteroidales bacterium]
MKKISPILLCLLFYLSGSGQEIQQLNYDSVLVKMTKQLVVYPEEKVHLHIDRQNYLAGEKIWFRAYLVNSCFHTQSNLSRYVYVELINPFDSIVSRNKIRSVEGNFSGYVHLPYNLPEGEYTLRAYTTYMKGLGEDYFYKRHLKIDNPMSARIQSSVKTVRNNKNKLKVSLKFSGNLQASVSVNNFQIRLKGDEFINIKNESDSTFYFDIPEELCQGNAFVLVSFQDDSKRKFSKYFKLDSSDDFDVSFLPEGGNLLAGCINRIAFKAVNTKGLDQNVKVDVLDMKGDTIVSAITLVNGMGLLTFFAQQNESYKAVCRNPVGKQKEIVLPKVCNKAYSLKLDQVQGLVVLEALAAPEVEMDSVFLLAHVRGVVIYADWWDVNKPILRFDQRIFPSGVIQFLLLDKHMNSISERLAFVDNNTEAVADLTLTTQEIKARQLITSEVQIKDQSGSRLVGNFSVSVVDESLTPADTSFNIKANLLLSSELRGYINNPAFYFQPDNKEAKLGLDLLMMIHGWRRYDIPEIIKGELELPLMQPEQSQHIAGSVKSGLLLNSNPGDNVDVSVVGVNNNYTDVTTTDKDGEFIFDGIEFPDSTGFVLQVLKKNGGKRLYLTILEDSIPNPIAIPVNSVEGHDEQFQKYIYYTEQALSQSSEQMNLIYLDEVKVVAEKRDDDDLPYTFTNTKVLEGSVLDSYTVLTFRELLEQQMRMIFDSDTPTFRGESVYFVVDEFEWSYEDLEYDLQMDNVEKIKLIKDPGAASFWGGGSNYGVTVWIKTKKGMYASGKDQFNLKKVFPVGYQRPLEFYAPKYETEEQRQNKLPDYRSTVYWNPVIVTDNQGQASFSFYSSDNTSDYTVVIEGICTNGKIIYLIKRLKNDF